METKKEISAKQLEANMVLSFHFLPQSPTFRVLSVSSRDDRNVSLLCEKEGRPNNFVLDRDAKVYISPAK